VAVVLLIEDDPDLRLLLETWLTRMEYVTISAASALEAVKTLAGSESRPGPVVDVALLDIVLPDLSGLLLLQRLRAFPSYARLPAIFLSASHDPADKAAARGMGAHFIPKPITRSVLEAALAAALA
jgi:DNA-binding response OmpR family regulator